MKRIVSIVLFVSLIISFSIPACANETNPEEEITRIKEEVELREPNADTFLMSDGSYECVVYSCDKYFENDSGKLVEIDNSIVNTELTIGEESYAYVNKANSTMIYFSNSKPAVYIDSKGKKLSFEMLDSQSTSAVAGGDETMGSIFGYELSGDNYITYHNAKPQTDMVYEVRNGLLKEYIVINGKDANTEFSYKFNSRYDYEIDKDGKVFFLNNGEAEYELGKLFAVDSAGAFTEDLEYTISEIDGHTIVKVSISDDFINNPSRVFPVLIDPSITIEGEDKTFDSYVSSLYPTVNYNSNNYLRTGRDSDYHIRRSYIKFKLPSYINSNNVDRVTAVYVKLKKYSGSTPNIKAYRVTDNWLSNEINWNNKPTNASQGFSFDLVSNNWYKANITTIAKKWFTDEPNYGLVVKDASETGTSQWTTFYSSNAVASNNPELIISIKANHQYLSYGYGSSTIYIHPYSFDSTTWENAVNQSREKWNNSSAPVSFNLLSSSNNYIFLGVYDGTYYGKYSPKDVTGSTVNRFVIYLNKNRITSAATNLSNFIKSVTVHELGHVVWLNDNPITSNSSIMKYSRNRNTMVNPSTYDIQNVTAKY